MTANISLDINELAHKLKKETQLSNEEIRRGTQQKIEEYHPIVQDKTAALILYARDHNVRLIESPDTDLDIENIVEDMSNIQIKAQLSTVEDFFTFTNSDGEESRGRETTLKDSTGEITLMLWGDQVDLITTEDQGKTVEINGAYSDRYKGELQIKLGRDADLEIIE